MAETRELKEILHGCTDKEVNEAETITVLNNSLKRKSWKYLTFEEKELEVLNI